MHSERDNGERLAMPGQIRNGENRSVCPFGAVETAERPVARLSAHFVSHERARTLDT